MMINVYQTEIGLFSLIQSSTVYNYLINNPPSDLVIVDTHGVITSAGQTFLDAVPILGGTYTYMANTDTAFNTDFLNVQYQILPITSTYNMGITTTFTDKTVTYPVLSGTDRTITVKGGTDPAGLVGIASIFNALDHDNIHIAELNNAFRYFPFGNFDTYVNGAALVDYSTIGICVANDDLTAFVALYLQISVNGFATFRARIQYMTVANETLAAKLSTYFTGLPPLVTNADPYDQGGIAETGGGSGTFDHHSVAVGVPNLPSVSAADTGFITLFNPSLSQLNSLASYMWSSLFDVEGWQKIFADPMDAILGLSIVPVNVPSGSSKEVKVGNIGTGIYMTSASTQYVVVDCGSLDVREYWGAYLDYAPYTKAELYLPYCGTHPVQVDDIMDKTVHIIYHVDILSGSCCAYVLCDDTVLYTFAGQCSSPIPINANNWTNVINGALSIAASVGMMVASGGMSAPLSAGTAVAAGASIAGTAMTMKPQVERSGSMGGTAGMLGIQVPYLILTRPRQALPENQNTYTGYPSYITSTLGDLTGWTTVSEIHLEGVPCTEGEAEEIVNILKSGVIL